MRKYLQLDRLEKGEKRQLLRRARFILVRRWVMNHPAGVLAIALGLGTLPLAATTGALTEWGILTLFFSAHFIADKARKDKARQVSTRTKRDTGPLG